MRSAARHPASGEHLSRKPEARTNERPPHPADLHPSSDDDRPSVATPAFWIGLGFCLLGWIAAAIWWVMGD